MLFKRAGSSYYIELNEGQQVNRHRPERGNLRGIRSAKGRDCQRGRG